MNRARTATASCTAAEGLYLSSAENRFLLASFVCVCVFLFKLLCSFWPGKWVQLHGATVRRVLLVLSCLGRGLCYGGTLEARLRMELICICRTIVGFRLKDSEWFLRKCGTPFGGIPRLVRPLRGATHFTGSSPVILESCADTTS